MIHEWGPCTAAELRSGASTGTRARKDEQIQMAPAFPRFKLIITAACLCMYPRMGTTTLSTVRPTGIITSSAAGQHARRSYFVGPAQQPVRCVSHRVQGRTVLQQFAHVDLEVLPASGVIQETRAADLVLTK